MQSATATFRNGRVELTESVDWPDGTQMESRQGLEDGLEKSDNPALLRGHARFEGREADGFRVRLGYQAVTARQVVLNIGTRSLIPPIEGLSSVEFIHAWNWPKQFKVPFPQWSELRDAERDSTCFPRSAPYDASSDGAFMKSKSAPRDS